MMILHLKIRSKATSQQLKDLGNCLDRWRDLEKDNVECCPHVDDEILEHLLAGECPKPGCPPQMDPTRLTLGLAKVRLEPNQPQEPNEDLGSDVRKRDVVISMNCIPGYRYETVIENLRGLLPEDVVEKIKVFEVSQDFPEEEDPRFFLKEAQVAPLGSNGAQVRHQDTSSDQRLPSILIVDDSQDAANMLDRLFVAHGYKTQVAYHWEGALAAAKAHLPDVILLDLGMPELDGIHLARLFREDEQFKDKVLVAVTGYANDRHQQQCEAAGFDFVLAKPAAWEDLKSTIDRLWSKRKMRF